MGNESMGNSSAKVVAIASSTGGPKALQALLSKLPGDLNAPVLIVQHMPENFTASLAERLNTLSELEVREAREGDAIESGKAYLSRGGLHMTVHRTAGKHVIRYSDEPPREGVKPCANYMYESLRSTGYDEIVCVVLTGMGSDGTQGIKSLAEKKKINIIVQNEETSAVYGMPRSVVRAGLTENIIPLEDIAGAIIKRVGVK